MAQKCKQEGYDCQLVSQPPSEELQTECPVCLHVIREPFLVDCCGYSYCRACIEDVHFKGRVCPMCGASFSMMADKRLQRELYQREVYCSNREDGCEWRGKLSQLDAHLRGKDRSSSHGSQHCKASTSGDETLHKNSMGVLRHQDSYAAIEDGTNQKCLHPSLAIDCCDKEGSSVSECEYSDVRCSYCGKLFHPSEVDKHKEQCVKRPYTCELCKEFRTTFEQVLAHYRDCKCYPVECPNRCSRKAIEKQFVERHLATDCPLSLVECEFHSVGCNVKLPRKEIKNHLKECSIKHCRLLVEQNQKAIERNEQLLQNLLERDAEIIALKAELEEQRDLVERKLQEIPSIAVEGIENVKEDVHLVKSEQRRALHSMREDISQLKDIQSIRDTDRELLMQRQEHLLRVSAVNIIPFEFTMENFREMKKSKMPWFSQAFYTHPMGYKLSIRVDAFGLGTPKNMSVFVYLMQGEFDDQLQWPFQGSITIQLLNQRGGEEEGECLVRKLELMECVRVEKRQRSDCGYGCLQFASHRELKHSYLKNNCLNFCVL